MTIELTKFLNALSYALDYVEWEVLHSTPYHGKRVAVLTNRMAAAVGLPPEQEYALTHAAVLHDCALYEYWADELSHDGNPPEELSMAPHCISGEEKMRKLSFYGRIEEAVLYHHERADGRGPFGKTAAETPLTAQLIHMADLMDVKFDLYTVDREKYERVLAWVREERDVLFSGACADAFLRGVDYGLLESIAGDGCLRVLSELLPSVTEDISVRLLKEMASLFAEITDYKSHFTWRHSIGIAEKAAAMGRFYGESAEMCDKLYIAGALHDIGKLLISNDILEKPGKLTPEEYREIQNHALGTWDMLHGIGGMEDITRWAALHHEKLDGSGYPFGLKGEELGRDERLLACLDIYQALVEERPYKAGLSHGTAMGILRKMGAEGQLDTGLIDDIDRCFGDGERAPAQRESAPALPKTGKGDREVWRCPVCGYEYEGSLPEDFICPRCEQPGSIFERAI